MQVSIQELRKRFGTEQEVGIGRDWRPGHPGRCHLRSPSKLPGAKNGQSCQDLRKREQEVRELRPLMTAHGPFHTLEARWYHTHNVL